MWRLTACTTVRQILGLKFGRLANFRLHRVMEVGFCRISYPQAAVVHFETSGEFCERGTYRTLRVGKDNGAIVFWEFIREGRKRTQRFQEIEPSLAATVLRLPTRERKRARASLERSWIANSFSRLLRKLFQSRFGPQFDPASPNAVSPRTGHVVVDAPLALL